MKKRIFIILCIVFIALIIFIPILYNACNGFRFKDYKVSDDGIKYNKQGEVLGYEFDEKSPSYDIIIPEKIGKIKITKIADDFLDYNTKTISTLEIPKTIVEIGYNAFSNATIYTVKYHGTISDWANIKLENGDSSPMQYATKIFISNGERLELLDEKLVIPKDVKVINSYTFFGWPCKTFELSEGVETIKKHAIVIKALYDYNEIDVILPKSIKKIEERAIVPYYSFSNVYNDRTDINVYYPGSKNDWNDVDYIYVSNDYTKTSIIGASVYVTTNGVYELIK